MKLQVQGTGYFIDYDSGLVKKGHTLDPYRRAGEYKTHISPTEMRISVYKMSEDLIDDLAVKSVLRSISGAVVANTPSSRGEIVDLSASSDTSKLDLIRKGNLEELWKTIIVEKIKILEKGEISNAAYDRAKNLSVFIFKDDEDLATEEDICALGDLFSVKLGHEDNEFYQASVSSKKMKELLKREYKIKDLKSMWFK